MMSTLLAIEYQSDQTAKPFATGLRNFDLLRALAVLFVLFDHTARIIKSSPHDLRNLGISRKVWSTSLFIHTSLVLLMFIERNSGETISVASFYIRRAFRHDRKKSDIEVLFGDRTAIVNQEPGRSLKTQERQIARL
jgi:hypothetical protein